MIFHSLDFVVFLAVVVAVYWRLPRRAQNAWLVGAGYVFYGYVHPWFPILLGLTTLVDYWAARGIAEWPGGRRFMLAMSLAVNLGVLGFFKYFNFFAENVGAVLALVGLDVSAPVLRVILPVGVSFYTFQELSYTIGVYRGRVEARRSLLDFATFVSLFPQLVAGPIERAERMLPQVERPRRFSWADAEAGLWLVSWGYFKKLVIADNVGIIANKVFSLSDPTFPVLWAGVFAFAMQIYADFSAYTDIARGVARWFGFDLVQNFRHPFLATGPADFWRRWHLSLSTWFRDFVYIPLGGSRHGRLREVVNILVTFLVSGLWHGASWNFVLWGAYHGVLVAGAKGLSNLYAMPRGLRAALWPARVAATFVLMLLGWLLFRETDATFLWRDLTLSPWAPRTEYEMGAYLFLLAALYSLPLWIHNLWAEWRADRPLERSWPSVTFRAAGAGVALAIILVFRSRQSLDFIYFHF
jgi:D-alanyl-lipoteichoic acid acyltransferase DltB (MBOAT superfamily)